MDIHEVKLGSRGARDRKPQHKTGLTVLPPPGRHVGTLEAPQDRHGGGIQDGSGDSGAMAAQGAQEAMAGSFGGHRLRSSWPWPHPSPWPLRPDPISPPKK